MKLFETRGVYLTRGVHSAVESKELLHMDILPILDRHFSNDGDECKEDNKSNLDAIKHKDGRVFSVFNNVRGHKIYIITEGLHLATSKEYGDKYPYTTVLFPEEY